MPGVANMKAFKCIYVLLLACQEFEFVNDMQIRKIQVFLYLIRVPNDLAKATFNSKQIATHKNSRFNILSSHCFPVSPSGQAQTYEELLLKHWPPFLHGEDLHGVDNAEMKDKWRPKTLLFVAWYIGITLILRRFKDARKSLSFG